MMKTFTDRHIGITPDSEASMLSELGYQSLDDLCNHAIAENIEYKLPKSANMTEAEFESHINNLGNKNTPTLALIGQGFYPNYCPAIIRRNILENPSWYTQYTPYQAEISQGRLEALFNFQTVITELTGLQIANASLLDEGNACSEAIFMAYRYHREKRSVVLVCSSIDQHNVAVIKSRFKYLNITIQHGDISAADINENVCAIITKQFQQDGSLNTKNSELFKIASQNGVIGILNSDLLALTLFQSAAELGAHICVGSGQRLGIPMGYGGPAAAFISCNEEFTRLVPGRIIGLSKDKHGNPAYRMALQTREQHIRREKATSNICTAQSLLAIMNSFFAIYHGPSGLTSIANHIRQRTNQLKNAFTSNGFSVSTTTPFDTIQINTEKADYYTKLAHENAIEWQSTESSITISLNQTTSIDDLEKVLDVFSIKINPKSSIDEQIPADHKRQTTFLQQAVFHEHYSETKCLRYIKSLEQKDLSLANSMIPLGSCTMKLNATIELLSLSNPNFANIHPQSHASFTNGYSKILNDLEESLALYTGFDATCLQPNSGAQGEFAGLMCIRDYFESIGENQRNVAFIPTSAHGTNPASASLCGLTIVPIKCLDNGEICKDDLTKKCEKYKDNLAVLMITYPSTFGVFDEDVKNICQLIHDTGGQVYMDGANMNAQVGLTSPATIGADVCHLNLHKTFCIPHGGGGPGVGPICVKSHLSPFLPSKNSSIAIANTKYGSASICLISYAYIKLMGNSELKRASQVAILNANYIAKRLANYYSVMFTNKNNCVAHELIIDCKSFKKDAKITVEDIAKRLMDYGFHAPTMSWPVPDSLMIEPTESEGKDEIDTFCEALILIREEIDKISNGEISVDDSPLRNAPHTQADIKQPWTQLYSQKEAFFPNKLNRNKFWPTANRIDNAFGDRNLICSCQIIMDDTTVKSNEVNA